jgi:hypothetical protein
MGRSVRCVHKVDMVARGAPHREWPEDSIAQTNVRGIEIVGDNGYSEHANFRPFTRR